MAEQTKCFRKIPRYLERVQALCLGATNQPEMFGQQSSRGEVTLGKHVTVNGETFFSPYHHYTADPTVNNTLTTQHLTSFQPCVYLSGVYKTVLFQSASSGQPRIHHQVITGGKSKLIETTAALFQPTSFANVSDDGAQCEVMFLSLSFLIIY